MQCTTLEDVEIFLFPGKRRRRGGPLGIYSSQARAPHPFSIDILLHILTDFERDTSICSRASIAHVAPGKAAATLTRTELEISSSSSPFWVVSLSLSCALSLSLFFSSSSSSNRTRSPDDVVIVVDGKEANNKDAGRPRLFALGASAAIPLNLLQKRTHLSADCAADGSSLR